MSYPGPERWMCENDSNGEPPELQVRWDEGACYIRGKYVAPADGWHREDYDGVRRHWCADHQPVWSRP